MRGKPAGFTLVEIAISIAILSVMALFFATIYESITLASARNSQDQEINDAIAQLKLQFSEFEDFCAANFAGTALSDALPAGQTVTAISRVDGAGNRVGDIFRQGGPLNSGVVVDEIRLVPNSTLTSQLMVATLTIRMRRPASAGGTSIERTIPVYAAVNSGQVVRCSAIAGNTMILRDQVCRMQNAGYAFYNAIGGYCSDDPRVRWVRGSLARARCPAGYVLAAHPDDPGASGILCRANNRGLPVRARTYTNGERAGGVNVVVFSASVDWSLNECRFIFPAGEDLAIVETHVRCVPAGSRPL